MTQQSDPFFRTFHALRIKGFAKVDTIGEVADLPLHLVEEHLAELAGREWALFREARELWQLTPVGREEHRLALAADVGGTHIAERLSEPYGEFLELNDAFKALCGEWQLKDGVQNHHDDPDYDADVVRRLVQLDAAAGPVVARFGEVLARLGSYGPRLAVTCNRVIEGDARMFTGVMCGSYHDVWMELHEDLILTQGIDRAAEGSF